MNSRMKILLAMLCSLLFMAGLAAQVSQAQEEKKEQTVVRQLKFMPKDPTVVFGIGGQSRLTTLADAAAVEKLVGKDAAKALVDQVDFEKEMIVLVSWTTSGPPEGMLKYQIQGTGEDRRVTFYVQGPPGARVRGQRVRIARGFLCDPQKRSRIV